MANSKEALIAVGMELFLKQSYRGTGINEILKAAGIPKGSFYHHFQSKECFALAVIDCYREKLDEDIRQTLLNASFHPPKRILTFMHRIMGVIIKSDFTCGCPFGSFGQELASISNVLRKPINEAFEIIHIHMTKCIKEGIAEGSIKKRDKPERIATFIISAIQGAIIVAKIQRNPTALTSVQKSIRLLFLQGS